jgi:hypothetical protein
MCFPRESIKILRYLCVWRVNASLVWVPTTFNLELPRVLGQLIVDHLPTSMTRAWNKPLQAWRDYQRDMARAKQDERPLPLMPNTLWPLQAVFMPYPGKCTYGRGERILWELKLLGSSADHMMFLETILPAMEEAGYSKDPRWTKYNSLWGRFDIEAIYVAHSNRWDPLVQAGNLDVHYRPSPTQWAEGRHGPPSSHYTEVHWLSPFDFTTPPEAFLKWPGLFESPTEYEEPSDGTHGRDPSIPVMIKALLTRLEGILEEQYRRPVDLWTLLEAEQVEQLQTALAHAKQTHVLRHILEHPPHALLGRLQDIQEVTPIDPVLWPYLDLASVLHIGEYTQFGHGTFVLI